MKDVKSVSETLKNGCMEYEALKSVESNLQGTNGLITIGTLNFFL